MREGEERNVDYVLSGIDRQCIMGRELRLCFMKYVNFKGLGDVGFELTCYSLRNQTVGSYSSL
jgi:hypothetical protein